MTEPAPEPAPTTHLWLDPAATAAWLQVDADSIHAPIVEWCRKASAAYCERQRQDLLTDELQPDGVTIVVTFAATDDIVMAGMIGAARLYARKSTPAGLASFGEFGASQVLRLDPDVARLLGTGAHATPVVG